MSEMLSPSRPLDSRLMVFVAVGAGVLLALAVVLWAQYGGAVFHEMILAGIALCF